MVLEAYCPYCRKKTQLVRSKFSIGWYIASTILTLGLGLFLYPIYHLLKPVNKCHICGAKINSSIFRNKPLFKEEENDNQDREH